MNTLSKRWAAAEAMEPERREHERNILAILYSSEMAIRDRAIDSAENVTRLPPRGDGPCQ